MEATNRKRKIDLAGPLEGEEQQALFKWAEMLSVSLRPELRLLYHVPNGGSRNRTEAAKLKGEGVRAGVPDLCLPVSRGGYHGLYIELKRISGGRVSPEQRKWLESLRQEGYMAVVCHGWDEARHTIESYLDGEAQYGVNKPVL